MNIFLEKMGFKPDEKVVIFHADDLGMCHAVNLAFVDIVEAGHLCSGSIMVPCPWFPEIASFAKAHKSDLDLGVHLTLTSEWEGFRWRPLSTQDPASGLMDEAGYFWRDLTSFHKHMTPGAVEIELRAQIEHAFSAGVDVTHLDTHMGALMHPDLAPIYIALSQEYRIPALIPRLTAEQILNMGVSSALAEGILGLIRSLEASGNLPQLDHVAQNYQIPGEDRWGEYANMIIDFPPGITHMIYHPARSGAEIEGIAKDHAVIRTSDWKVFKDRQLIGKLDGLGVSVQTYRGLRDVMRAD